MIAVDTNIVVRLLTRDDEQQYQKSIKLFQDQDIFIPDSVILETELVLRFAYKFRTREICQAFRNLFGLANVSLVNTGLIRQTLEWHEHGLDFANAFHLANSQNCAELYTFDEKFRKKAKGLTVCTVKTP
jgi:predicted nucleic-acid-binding protein